MDNMKEEALRRANQMHRGAAFPSEQKVMKSPQDNNPQKIPAPEAENSIEPPSKKELIPPNIFEDKEKLLILILILLLSSEETSDPVVILCLLYLII